MTDLVNASSVTPILIEADGEVRPSDRLSGRRPEVTEPGTSHLGYREDLA